MHLYTTSESCWILYYKPHIIFIFLYVIMPFNVLNSSFCFALFNWNSKNRKSLWYESPLKIPVKFYIKMIIFSVKWLKSIRGRICNDVISSPLVYLIHYYLALLCSTTYLFGEPVQCSPPDLLAYKPLHLLLCPPFYSSCYLSAPQ